MADDSLPVKEPMPFHPTDTPRGMLYYNLEELTDSQQKNLNALKINTVREDEKYLAAHPEIRAIIVLLLRKLLRRRPMVKIHEFIAQFFNRNESDIEDDIYEYLGTRKDHRYEDLSAVNIALSKKPTVKKESIIDRPLEFTCEEECTCDHALQWKLSKYKAFDKSGVCQLTCSGCNSISIGHTGLCFNIRYKEHSRSFQYQKGDSAMAAHCLNERHPFPEFQDIKKLHCCDKSKRLNFLESKNMFRASRAKRDKDVSFTETEHWMTPKSSRTSMTLADTHHEVTTDEDISFTQLAQIIDIAGVDEEEATEAGSTIDEEDSFFMDKGVSEDNIVKETAYEVETEKTKEQKEPAPATEDGGADKDGQLEAEVEVSVVEGVEQLPADKKNETLAKEGEELEAEAEKVEKVAEEKQEVTEEKLEVAEEKPEVAEDKTEVAEERAEAAEVQQEQHNEVEREVFEAPVEVKKIKQLYEEDIDEILSAAEEAKNAS